MSAWRTFAWRDEDVDFLRLLLGFAGYDHRVRPLTVKDKAHARWLHWRLSTDGYRATHEPPPDPIGDAERIGPVEIV